MIENGLMLAVLMIENGLMLAVLMIENVIMLAVLALSVLLETLDPCRDTHMAEDSRDNGRGNKDHFVHLLSNHRNSCTCNSWIVVFSLG